MTTPNQRTCDSTWGCFQDAWNQLVSRWSKSRRVIMISYGKKTHATIHKLWEPHWIRGWHRIRLHLKHSENMALTIEFGAGTRMESGLLQSKWDLDSTIDLKTMDSKKHKSKYVKIVVNFDDVLVRESPDPLRYDMIIWCQNLVRFWQMALLGMCDMLGPDLTS